MEEKDLKRDVFNRLVEFKDNMRLNLNAFAGEIGMDHSTLHYQFHGKRALSLDAVLNTLESFKELSAEWLLRGTGDMIITESAESTESTEKKQSERIEALVDTITLLQETIQVKNATIDDLKAELALYKNQTKEA